MNFNVILPTKRFCIEKKKEEASKQQKERKRKEAKSDKKRRKASAKKKETAEALSTKKTTPPLSVPEEPKPSAGTGTKNTSNVYGVDVMSPSTFKDLTNHNLDKSLQTDQVVGQVKSIRPSDCHQPDTILDSYSTDSKASGNSSSIMAASEHEHVYLLSDIRPSQCGSGHNTDSISNVSYFSKDSQTVSVKSVQSDINNSLPISSQSVEIKSLTSEKSKSGEALGLPVKKQTALPPPPVGGGQLKPLFLKPHLFKQPPVNPQGTHEAEKVSAGYNVTFGNPGHSLLLPAPPTPNLNEQGSSFKEHLTVNSHDTKDKSQSSSK